MIRHLSRKAVSRLALTPRALHSIVGTSGRADTVVLTYDDGPEPGGTDRVLAALSDAGVSATFFMLSRRARSHPGLVAEVLDAGHEIALHGRDHRRLTDFSALEVRRRTSDAKAELEDAAGVAVRWFRPPYGRQGVGAAAAVRSLGLTPVMWSGGLRDWEHITDDERIRRAVPEAVPGAILLGHDGYASLADGVDDGPEPDVDRYRVTFELLAAMRDAGLRGRSLDHAMSDASAMTEGCFRW